MPVTHSPQSMRAFRARSASGWSCAKAMVIVAAGAACWAATIVVLLKL